MRRRTEPLQYAVICFDSGCLEGSCNNQEDAIDQAQRCAKAAPGSRFLVAQVVVGFEAAVESKPLHLPW